MKKSNEGLRPFLEKVITIHKERTGDVNTLGDIDKVFMKDFYPDFERVWAERPQPEGAGDNALDTILDEYENIVIQWDRLKYKPAKDRNSQDEAKLKVLSDQRLDYINIIKGAKTKTVQSLEKLGLCELTVETIAEVITDDGLTQPECITWLEDNRWIVEQAGRKVISDIDNMHGRLMRPMPQPEGAGGFSFFKKFKEQYDSMAHNEPYDPFVRTLLDCIGRMEGVHGELKALLTEKDERIKELEEKVESNFSDVMSLGQDCARFMTEKRGLESELAETKNLYETLFRATKKPYQELVQELKAEREKVEKCLATIAWYEVTFEKEMEIIRKCTKEGEVPYKLTDPPEKEEGNAKA